MISRKMMVRIGMAAFVVVEVALLVIFTLIGNSQPAEGLIARKQDVSLEVPSQTGDWGTVRVQRVVAPESVWVVVQTRNASGAGGRVIGSTLVPSGRATNLTIGLDPTQAASNSLVVALIADRGERGALEYTPSLSGTGGGGGGMGMAASSDSKSAAPSAPVTSADKPISAGGRRVAVILDEVMRLGSPGQVQRVARQAP